MLELQNVSKQFRGIVAVERVSFRALPGEVTGYLGPNGSGKSTTMKMISGLIEASSGTILFEQQPIQRDVIAYKQRLGYVPEEPHLYGHLSALEYLVMAGQLRDLSVAVIRERVLGLLKLFSLEGDRHVPISLFRKACGRRCC